MNKKGGAGIFFLKKVVSAFAQCSAILAQKKLQKRNSLKNSCFFSLAWNLSKVFGKCHERICLHGALQKQNKRYFTLPYEESLLYLL